MVGLADTELSYDERVDPEGKAFWPDNPGRDGCRTPMVWEAAAPHAAFSDAERTWLPVTPPRAAPGRAGRQEADPEKVQALHRRMIALRAARPALRHSQTRFLDTAEPLLAFWRGGDAICAFDSAAPPAPSRPTPISGWILRQKTSSRPARGSRCRPAASRSPRASLALGLAADASLGGTSPP